MFTYPWRKASYHWILPLRDPCCCLNRLAFVLACCCGEDHKAMRMQMWQAISHPEDIGVVGYIFQQISTINKTPQRTIECISTCKMMDWWAHACMDVKDLWAMKSFLSLRTFVACTQIRIAYLSGEFYRYERIWTIRWHLKVINHAYKAVAQRWQVGLWCLSVRCAQAERVLSKKEQGNTSLAPF